MHLSLTSLPHKLHRLLGIDRRRAARDRAVVLKQHRIFILPTRYGLLFGLLTFVMLVGATNYNNSTGFLLSFLLLGIALASVLHAYHNMLRLSVEAGRAGAVFCGEPALFAVVIDNSKGPRRTAVGLHLKGQPPVFTDLAAGGRAVIDLPLPTPRRGWLPIGTLTVFTHYPLGLFRAWSQLRLEAYCLVFPAPAPSFQPSPSRPSDAGTRSGQRPGSDDFMGFRSYHPGDSPRHVDWKAVARGKALLTKLFCDNEGKELWLNWDDCTGQDAEARLSQLCRGVLWADHTGYRYGLNLPGGMIAPACGEAHKYHCLKALALFGTTA